MNFKISTTRVPIKVPTFYYKKMYSEPKIHIAYKTNAKGKKVACVDKGCNWYVYFYFRHPATLKMTEKFIFKKGINTVKSVTERRVAANNLRLALKELLENGFNPFNEFVEADLKTEDIEQYTVVEAFDMAFKSRCNEWKQSTIDTNTAHFGVLKKWLKRKDIERVLITEFKRKNVVQFLDYLVANRKVNKTTRNNYKRTVSSLLSKMVEMELLEYNPADKIKLLKTTPFKNKPFSNTQLVKIKKWLQTNDPYLELYLKFVAYGFMRPNEVNRMLVKNIYLEQRYILVETKTSNNTIPIIDTLYKVIQKMELDKENGNFFVFTKYGVPALWQTNKEKSKVDYFSRKFKNLKKALKLGNEYGLYSFRHNAALNLYHSFVAGGMQENEAVNKLQKIMRHTDSKTTRIYLRDIGAFAIDDYSNDYTFEF